MDMLSESPSLNRSAKVRNPILSSIPRSTSSTPTIYPGEQSLCSIRFSFEHSLWSIVCRLTSSALSKQDLSVTFRTILNKIMQHPLTDRRCEGSATAKDVTSQSRNRMNATGCVEAARLPLARLITVATIGIILPIYSISSSLILAAPCLTVAKTLEIVGGLYP